jgi:hypothetical protein
MKQCLRTADISMCHWHNLTSHHSDTISRPVVLLLCPSRLQVCVDIRVYARMCVLVFVASCCRFKCVMCVHDFFTAPRQRLRSAAVVCAHAHTSTQVLVLVFFSECVCLGYPMGYPVTFPVCMGQCKLLYDTTLIEAKLLQGQSCPAHVTIQS